MKDQSGQHSEVARLEELWSGRFGDDYVQRNRSAATGRESFWEDLLERHPVRSVLEVGCNVGANLHWLSQHVPARSVYGIDVNETALRSLRTDNPAVNALWAPARQLPFRDRWFDLVFTTGVLIHQPPQSLPIVMSEIVRCARKYVLCGEYYSAEPEEVLYHDQERALWKRDFGGLYQELFPELKLLDEGYLPKAEGGWDDVTWWLYEVRRDE